MSHVPYASAVGNIMYAMVYTRLDISHVVSVVSIWISLERSIDKQWNEYFDTWEEHPMLT